MKKQRASIIKQIKSLSVHKPDVDFKFYAQMLGDNQQDFNMDELSNIRLLGEDEIIGEDLLDIDLQEEEFDIFGLLEEGVLEDQPTGADLGIYNYKPVKKPPNYWVRIADKVSNAKAKKISDLYPEDTIDDEYDEYAFSHCKLAQDDVLGGDDTQIVHTFKGYLDVRRPEGTIVAFDVGKNAVSRIFIDEEKIDLFKLRSGDELVCTYLFRDGKWKADAIMTINGIHRSDWTGIRKFIRDITNNKSMPVSIGGDYTEVLVNNFNLVSGDNVFIYINKSTNRPEMLNRLITEFADMFDKVIYINPQYKNNITNGMPNVLKFCAMFSDSFYRQKISALLGVAHAKRLIELGNNVAIVIDDINSIVLLDRDDMNRMPISKTVLNCAFNTDCGSSIAFTVAPIFAEAINSFASHDIFRSLETIGVIVDNNEIDLFNSYRA